MKSAPATQSSTARERSGAKGWRPGRCPRRAIAGQATSIAARLASASGAGSQAATSRPASRNRAAQPDPMTPAPTTAILSISNSSRSLPGSVARFPDLSFRRPRHRRAGPAAASRRQPPRLRRRQRASPRPAFRRKPATPRPDRISSPFARHCLGGRRYVRRAAQEERKAEPHDQKSGAERRQRPTATGRGSSPSRGRRRRKSAGHQPVGEDRRRIVARESVAHRDARAGESKRSEYALTLPARLPASSAPPTITPRPARPSATDGLAQAQPLTEEHRRAAPRASANRRRERARLRLSSPSCRR